MPEESTIPQDQSLEPQEVTELLRQMSRETFGKAAIVNDICAQFQKMEGEEKFLMPGTAESISFFTKTVSAYFAGLLSFCSKLVYNRTHDRYLAEELAQEAMLELLKPEANLRAVRPWLYSVVMNKLADCFQQHSKENGLQEQLGRESILAAMSENNDKSAAYYEYLMEVPELRDLPEYGQYLELLSFPDLKAYAAAKGISYDQAKKISVRLKHDLKAYYLRLTGWETGLEIYDYPQYLAIKQLMKVLTMPWSAKKEMALNKYRGKLTIDELKQVYGKFTGMNEFKVCKREEKGYHDLFVFQIREAQIPLASTCWFQISPTNRISLIHCYANELVACCNASIDLPLRPEKGKTKLPLKDLIYLLKQEKSTRFYGTDL
ncbi:MAG TPA: hypothetical protein PLX59_03520 [Candidatus Cloacimonadota bacterium]|nr:hypothetical protein [Candidatus Cloacimonadota bacterium]